MVNARVREVLEFKSQTGQILHSVANGLPPLQHLRKYLCCLSATMWSCAPQTHYTLRGNTSTASIMKRLD